MHSTNFCETEIPYYSSCYSPYYTGRSGFSGLSGYSGQSGIAISPFKESKKRKSFITEIKSIGKTMKDDVKNFIIENRKIIYWLAILLILDQWVFEGKFREKLHELFEALINRVKKFFETEPNNV